MTQFLESFLVSPGLCNSVGRALSLKAEGHRFDSQSGYMPGLWGSALGWGSYERQPTQPIDVSLTH